MKKKVYRFRWSESRRRFEGPQLTAEPERFKNSVQQITREIAENSGIRKPRPASSAFFFFLTILCGYTVSFILILNKQYGVGAFLLVLTPLCAFVAVARPLLRKKRVDLVNAFVRRKILEFQGLTRCDGFVLEPYFFQCSCPLPQLQTTHPPQKSPACTSAARLVASSSGSWSSKRKSRPLEPTRS
jgi:hypothetical protein